MNGIEDNKGMASRIINEWHRRRLAEAETGNEFFLRNRVAHDMMAVAEIVRKYSEILESEG